MVFSSFVFIYLFLPLSLLLYFLSPRRLKNPVLLLCSMLFYAWGSPRLLPLLLLSCACDYWVSRRLTPGMGSERFRRSVLTGSVGLNLGLLAYFKYANFFVSQADGVLALWGFSPLPWSSVALPIGISFFTFHKISYLIDVYRGDTPPAASVLDHMLYILLFPQLIAGPIIRYQSVQSAIRARRTTAGDAFEGMLRFCQGLGKKVLIADPVGLAADNIFGIPAAQLTCGYAWLGSLCYAFQIYFDFSGYSDMAIGLGRIFGFTFCENFNRPYLSLNFTEFWRRWHISLSTWMRLYLYIPLGGNRGTRLRTCLNLWTVFLLSGLWHGASWNFVLWGAYHGFFLALDKAGWLEISKRLPRLFNLALTFFLVVMGWVLFRAETLPQAVWFYEVLFGWQSPAQPLLMARAEIIHNRAVFVLCLAALLVFAPALRRPRTAAPAFSAHPLLWGSAALVLLLLSSASLAALGFTPFLYFRF